MLLNQKFWKNENCPVLLELPVSHLDAPHLHVPWLELHPNLTCGPSCAAMASHWIPPSHTYPSSNALPGLLGLLFSWLNMLQQQQYLLAKKGSHTKLSREKLQVQPQPEPASPRNAEGRMPGCILLATDLAAQQAAGDVGVAHPMLHSSTSFNQPVQACRPSTAHSMSAQTLV